MLTPCLVTYGKISKGSEKYFRSKTLLKETISIYDPEREHTCLNSLDVHIGQVCEMHIR
jgi:hypothetical protein